VLTPHTREFGPGLVNLERMSIDLRAHGTLGGPFRSSGRTYVPAVIDHGNPDDVAGAMLLSMATCIRLRQDQHRYAFRRVTAELMPLAVSRCDR